MPTTKNKTCKLSYNNTCKKARITIFKSELDKCMTNQPFEINYQLPKKPKPPIIVDPDPRPPKPKTTRELLLEFIDETRNGFANIRKILNEHSEILNSHSEILNEHSEILNKHSEILMKHAKIFKSNNLK